MLHVIVSATHMHPGSPGQQAIARKPGHFAVRQQPSGSLIRSVLLVAAEDAAEISGPRAETARLTLPRPVLAVHIIPLTAMHETVTRAMDSEPARAAVEHAVVLGLRHAAHRAALGQLHACKAVRAVAHPLDLLRRQSEHSDIVLPPLLSDCLAPVGPLLDALEAERM